MRVLLIVDKLNWAWGTKANYIKKYLDQFDIRIITQDKYHRGMIQTSDSVHSFSWLESPIRYKATTSISSHGFELFYKERSEKWLPEYSAVTALSKILFKKLTDKHLNKNIYLCENGVDEELFYPSKTSNTKFVIGWVGKETHGNFDGNDSKVLDIKGYENLLLPIKEKLKEYSDIEFLIHSRKYNNSIPHSEMPKIYNQMDLFICTSFLEGGPQPLFEAASCGLPVISTRVGCAPELIIDNNNGFLVNSYKNKEETNKIVEAFVEKILFFKNNRELCKQFGENNRKIIENDWTWKKRVKQWSPVFKNHRLR